jgi:sortase A
MKTARVMLKDWVAWMLIAGGIILLGKVGLDAARAAAYQHQYRSALDNPSLPHASSNPSRVPSAASIGEPIGWLEIPRLRMSAAVVHGDTDALLKTAIGHLPDTPLPWSEGNTALAGHRDTFFRPLRDVRPDDTVRLKTAYGEFQYRVRETFVVDPGEVWVLDPTPAAMLTLITCYPFDYIGNAPRRFIVRAERIDERRRDAGSPEKDVS